MDKDDKFPHLIFYPLLLGIEKYNLLIMLALACSIYVFMCFISNWNLLWPLTMLSKGGLGDKAIAIIWAILLIAGLI